MQAVRRVLALFGRTVASRLLAILALICLAGGIPLFFYEDGELGRAPFVALASLLVFFGLVAAWAALRASGARRTARATGFAAGFAAMPLLILLFDVWGVAGALLVLLALLDRLLRSDPDAWKRDLERPEGS